MIGQGIEDDLTMILLVMTRDFLGPRMPSSLAYKRLGKRAEFSAPFSKEREEGRKREEEPLEEKGRSGQEEKRR